MMHTRKLWVDVTLLYEWSGNFTGMQRVLFSYLTRLNGDNTIDLHLFIARSNSFDEVSIDTLMTLLKKDKSSEDDISRGFTSNLRALPRNVRAHGLSFLKRNTRNIPIVGDVLASGYVAARTFYRNTKHSKDERAFSSPIQKDDTVLLIDGNWQDEGRFARQLVREKRKIGFTLIHIVHDVIAIKNPGYVADGASEVIGSYFRAVLPIIDTLISVSHSTQKDVESIAQLWGIEITEDRHVIRIGDTLDIKSGRKGNSDKIDKAITTLPSRFMLCVCTLEIRKNHRILFYLYKLAKQHGIDLPPTVLVGREGWMSEETVYLLRHDSDISEKIILLGSLSDTSLQELYQKSWLTIFPSLYEGWGLPVVESLRYGKICITSNNSSLPEAGGELADYISPADPAQLLATIEGYLKDDKLVIQKEELIKRNYKSYSWDDSYRELYSVMKVGRAG